MIKWFESVCARFGNWFNWRYSATNSGNTTVNAKNSVVNIGSASPNCDLQQQDRNAKVEILFIDDDHKNQIATAVRNAGFTHTSQVKDIANLDDPKVKNADVLFVDVIGVGQKLFPREQGLGLAVALKDRYPKKRVAVYSTEPGGNRADPKLRKIDAFLDKTSQPYVFIQLIQEWVQPE
jgi:hypothetical protein